MVKGSLSLLGTTMKRAQQSSSCGQSGDPTFDAEVELIRSSTDTRLVSFIMLCGDAKIYTLCIEYQREGLPDTLLPVMAQIQ